MKYNQLWMPLLIPLSLKSLILLGWFLREWKMGRKWCLWLFYWEGKWERKYKSPPKYNNAKIFGRNCPSFLALTCCFFFFKVGCWAVIIIIIIFCLLGMKAGMLLELKGKMINDTFCDFFFSFLVCPGSIWLEMKPFLFFGCLFFIFLFIITGHDWYFFIGSLLIFFY